MTVHGKLAQQQLTHATVACYSPNACYADLSRRGTGEVVHLEEEFRLLTLQVIGEAILSLPPEECDRVRGSGRQQRQGSGRALRQGLSTAVHSSRTVQDMYAHR
jgi:hypothetical protein